MVLQCNHPLSLLLQLFAGAIYVFAGSAETSLFEEEIIVKGVTCNLLYNIIIKILHSKKKILLRLI